jgi:hypothetical protein
MKKLPVMFVPPAARPVLEFLRDNPGVVTAIGELISAICARDQIRQKKAQIDAVLAIKETTLTELRGG